MTDRASAEGLRAALERFFLAADDSGFWGRVAFYLGPIARTAVDPTAYNRVKGAYDALRSAALRDHSGSGDTPDRADLPLGRPADCVIDDCLCACHEVAALATPDRADPEPSVVVPDNYPDNWPPGLDMMSVGYGYGLALKERATPDRADHDPAITIREKNLRDAWLRLDAVGDPRTAHALWQHLRADPHE